MNSKTAKTLRKFAEFKQFPYTQVKHLFERRSKAQQRIDIWMMREAIRRGVKQMAEQKICDRSHKVVIPAGEEFYALTFKTPNGEERLDLCAQCGLEFKAFMSAAPAQSPAAPQAPAAPADQQQPANGQPAA